MSYPWLNLILVMAFLGSLTVGLRWLQTRYTLHPELVRKLVHIPMGLLTLSFPWLFPQALPVLVLAALAIAWLLFLRLYPPLRDTLGHVLGGVKRRSLGEIYFPLAVAILFVLSRGDPLLFGVPMLMLTLADAIAAIIGVQYGRVHYAAMDGVKSAEGSIAFFMVTFFSVHIPLLLATHIGRAESLLIAVILGVLVMLLEAIAWQGLDNLFIPIGGFILLKTHLTMTVPDLLLRLAITLLLAGMVVVWRRRTTLNDSALLGAVVIGYLSWSLGGWRWLIAPLTLLLCYPFLIQWIDQGKTPLTPMERQVMIWLPAEPGSPADFKFAHTWERVHNIYAVLSVTAGGLLWLVLYGLESRHSLIYPYTLAFAANLAVIGTAGLSPRTYWQRTAQGQVAGYVVKSWLLLCMPLLLLEQFSSQAIAFSLLSPLGIGIAALAYYCTQPFLRQQSTDTLNWVCRASYTTLSSLVAGLYL